MTDAISQWNPDETLVIRKGQWSDLWNLWQAAETRAEGLAAALERAQAAAEGVDMLLRQAERRGALKAWAEGYRQALGDIDWSRPTATRKLTENPYA